MKEQTTIRLPAEMKEQLVREAKENGDSFNGTVIRLIRLGMKLESRHALAHKRKCIFSKYFLSDLYMNDHLVLQEP